jgi:hypothetical protein
MAEPFKFLWTDFDYDFQARSTFYYVDWTAVLEEARKRNHGRSCVYDGHDREWRNGGSHLTRRIKFIDTGDLWLVRLPQIPIRGLPRVEDEDIPDMMAGRVIPPEWWTDQRVFAFESEIATMIYVAENTDIPVPEIYGWNSSIDGNPAKLPFVFMQCINGNILQDIRGEFAHKTLTKDERTKIKKAMAWIQVCRTPTIILIWFSSF